MATRKFESGYSKLKKKRDYGYIYKNKPKNE